MPGVLDVVDRERADHRARSSSSAELARDDVLRQLVGDDGGERRPRRAPIHCLGCAASERSATEIGASAVRARSGAELAASGPCSAQPLLLLALVLDAERRPRQRLQPLRLDRLAAARRRCRTCRRRSARARRRSRPGPASTFSSSGRRHLAVERHRGDVAEVVVLRGRLARSRRRASRGARCGGCRSPPTRCRAPRAGGRGRRSVSIALMPLPPSRRSASAASRPRELDDLVAPRVPGDDATATRGAAQAPSPRRCERQPRSRDRARGRRRRGPSRRRRTGRRARSESRRATTRSRRRVADWAISSPSIGRWLRRLCSPARSRRSSPPAALPARARRSPPPPARRARHGAGAARDALRG